MIKRTAHGFTIIELMFSTVVFSLILLLCLASLVQIGKLYYKGVTTAQTQEATRNVMDELTQSVQLNAGTISFPTPPAGPDIAPVPSQPATTNTSGYFCIGDILYSYVIDRQQTDGTADPQLKQIHHVLWAQDLTNCASTATGPSDLTLDTPSAASTHGRELLGPHMRLLRINITHPLGSTAPNLWQIDLAVGYGDDDLFLVDNAATPVRKYCKTADAGTQFCATSELNTIVNRRLVSLL